MGACLSTSIEEESKLVKELVLSSKKGKWKVVLTILKMHPHLLNAIPEDRRWGILHQAVWWKDLNVLKELLKLPTCDHVIRTKESRSDDKLTSGFTPIEIARLRDCKDMEDILKNYTPIGCSSMLDLSTYHFENKDIELNGLGLLRVTLASYRETFCPFPIAQNKPLYLVMGQIFRHVDTGKNWELAKTRICDSLFPVNSKSAKLLNTNTETKEDFYKKIIHIYSTEDTRLYTFLNTALRHQEEHNYRPTADDLALGPYILMFHLLLFHWRVLLPESGVTYRRMQLTTKDARQYKTGTTFFWLSFVSSSVVLKKATVFPTITSTGEENQIVLFIIDNNNESMWKPKNIEKYAMYQEKERVYPAAAKFEVTKVDETKDVITINLKLLSNLTVSQQSNDTCVLM